MVAWTRSARVQRCGGCGREIFINEPVLVIAIDHHTSLRCSDCEPAPPDWVGGSEDRAPSHTRGPRERDERS
jgi:hypothetical protein